MNITRKQRLKLGEAFEYANATIATLNGLVGELNAVLIVVKCDPNYGRLSKFSKDKIAEALKKVEDNQ